MRSSKAPRRVFPILALAVLGCLACLPAMAVDIKGFMYQPFGTPWGDNAVAVQKVGAGGSGNQGGATTFGTAPLGWFGFSGLNSGTYSMMFAPKDQYPRQYLPAVFAGGPDILVQRNPHYITGARNYFRTWNTSYAQSFIARGNYVTHVSIRFPHDASVRCSIHEGDDPNGPQIGPEKWIDGSFANDTFAPWSAGEVPVVPGQKYTVKFWKPDNSIFSVCYADGRNMNGYDFPGGKTWVAGQPFGLPLRMVVGFDNDGVSSTLNTTTVTKDYASINQHVTAGGVVGQTFKATGTSVIGASCMMGVSAPFEVSIFQSPGVDGKGVGQIGPSKWMVSIAWNARSVVSWSPGEVPTTPGETYYLRFRHVTNSAFSIYRTIADEYPHGDFYLGSVPITGSDLGGFIASEESAGSTLVPAVTFADWKVVSRTSTAATISWKTVKVDPTLAAVAQPENLPTTGRIDYGIGADYTESLAVTDSAAEHTVQLTGLQPGQEYHVQIHAEAPNTRPALSKDFCFVTEPEDANLAANPGFESGLLSPWVKWNAMNVRNYPAGGSGWLGGVKARTGNYYVGGESNGGQMKGGAYQRLAVNPAAPVNLRACLWTYQVEGTGNFDATVDYSVLGRIGIDPTGGTDRNSPAIVWSPMTSGQQWYDLTPGYDAEHPSRYTDIRVSARPQSDHVTVFLEAGCNNAITWTIYAFDDVYVWQDQKPAVPVESIGALAGVQDGERVSLQGLVVTASSAEAGANYVQEADRSAGLRVESDVAFTRDHFVNVEGVLGTKPSGERYLSDAMLTSDSPGVGAIPMGARCSAIGSPSEGLANVGLLMRTWGRVGVSMPGYFYLNDGSLPGDGLRIETGASGVWPSEGSVVSVSGVVQLSGAAPSAVPVLRVRDTGDLTDL